MNIGDIMKTRQEVIDYCLTFQNVYEDYPFSDENWICMRHQENKKVFAWIFERQGYIWVNVKGTRGWLDFFREKYESVVPGYHMHKGHWNSIILDETVLLEDIQAMIHESYDLTLSLKRYHKKSKGESYESIV